MVQQQSHIHTSNSSIWHKYSYYASKQDWKQSDPIFQAIRSVQFSYVLKFENNASSVRFAPLEKDTANRAISTHQHENFLMIYTQQAKDFNNFAQGDALSLISSFIIQRIYKDSKLQNLCQIIQQQKSNDFSRKFVYLPFLLKPTRIYIILLQVIKMSHQIDGFLQMGASYNFQRSKLNNIRSKTIDSQGFQKWSEGNMYKSSYSHFHSKDSIEPKNTAIPGYGGYIPSIKAENIHARGYSAIAKQSFQNERLGRNTFGLSTTGFNLKKEALIDNSKIASSSKYGKTEIQGAHPGWNADWRSTTHESFKPPGASLNPTYRQTDKWLQTKKSDTKGSGYSTNHAYLDGKGWHPDSLLKGDNHSSEYRDRLNADHPFHRDVHVSKLAQLGKKQYNYRFN